MDSSLNTDSDRELLRRFADAGEEAAFSRLVDRHAAMVRGVAMRCTGDAAMSDEVAQSVFFLLASRAGSVPADHLGGWLHRTAFLTARNARRNSLRYKQALRELGRHHDVMTDTSNSDPHLHDSPWEEIHPYLDEAVARLPERVRRPVMLRFFESRSIRDIASLTGKSEDAVRKVLERSLQRLSGLLRRRGVATNGTALGVMLSAHSLLAPPASAAALAASALSASNLAGAAVGPALFTSGPLGVFGSPSFLKGAGVALLLATLPVAMLWRQNRALRQDLDAVRERMRDVRASSQVKPAVEVPAVAPASTVVAATQPGEKAVGAIDKNSPAALKEKSVKEAARELARMNLYLPGLTDDQRARILAVYEERSLRRTEAFEQARQTGAFARLAGGIKNLTAEDKALFKAAHAFSGEASPESEALKTILTDDQYALHLEAAERRRVNDAEGVASDTLRSLGQSFDLSQEQKDDIFQDVAQFELNPPADEADIAAGLPGPFREEWRDRVIRQHLSEEQTALFDQRREDDRRRREQFLQNMQPAR
jgi:RNA polymerase sigma factor (sigma-70 family)